VHPDAIASLACLRPLQRMGEEIGNDEVARIAILAADVEREFASLTAGTGGGDATDR